MKGRASVNEMMIAEQRSIEGRSEKKASLKEVKQLTEASLGHSAMTKSINKSSAIRNLGRRFATCWRSFETRQ